jgi:hypothetical protein
MKFRRLREGIHQRKAFFALLEAFGCFLQVPVIWSKYKLSDEQQKQREECEKAYLKMADPDHLPAENGRLLQEENA